MTQYEHSSVKVLDTFNVVGRIHGAIVAAIVAVTIAATIAPTSRGDDRPVYTPY